MEDYSKNQVIAYLLCIIFCYYLVGFFIPVLIMSVVGLIIWQIAEAFRNHNRK